MKKIIIVGGVAGGASAAARIRRLDENAQIIIFERSGFISYANCGLPYYIGGEIENQKALTLQTPDSFWNRFRINVLVKHEVTAINSENKTVTVHDLDTDTIYQESYDNLILSPGAKPTMPNISGIDNNNIFTLRTVEDALKIKQYVEESNPISVNIIGGGYIGIEMAENLAKLGIKVTLIEYANQILSTIDYDMSCFVSTELKSHGIQLMLNSAVTRFEEKDEKIITFIQDKPSITADMIILSVGVTPDTSLAKSAGLKLGIKGSICVNEKMQTSVPDIYAVGDAIEVNNYISGNKALISLAGPANRQGRIAADNICGTESKYHGSQGSSIIKIFDMTVAATGLNESSVKKSRISYEKIVLSPTSHATYYPGSKGLTIKLIYEKESKDILGAQIIGFDGVDKRIDVIATAIRAKLKVTQLTELELAYAPPYSSAKDPVNIAGFMAENIENGIIKQFHYYDVEELKKRSDVFLLDTRTQYEYNIGHADEFINIPVDNLREELEKIPKNKSVYVMCQSGLRSYIACRILSQKGYNCYNFSGGYRFYSTVMDNLKQDESIYPCGVTLREGKI